MSEGETKAIFIMVGSQLLFSQSDLPNHPTQFYNFKGQTLPTFQRNFLQHCWVQHAAYVWALCCDMLQHVGCCWIKFGKVCIRAPSGFHGMKRLGVFLLPPGWDASPSQGYPQHFAGTHLYTWVERGTVRVKCLAQEHNTMSLARGPFLESPETLRAIFGCHNSFCNSRTESI